MKKGSRKLSDITDEEKKMIEDEWFPNFIIGKFVALRFEDSKIMLDYTVGGGAYSMSVGDSPEHILILHEMGFNVIGFRRSGLKDDNNKTPESPTQTSK